MLLFSDCFYLSPGKPVSQVPEPAPPTGLVTGLPRAKMRLASERRTAHSRSSRVRWAQMPAGARGGGGGLGRAGRPRVTNAREVHCAPVRSHCPSTPNPGRPRQIPSKGDRGSTGKDSAGFRNVEIRLGAATAASSERGPPGARPPGRARGSSARGGRAQGPGRAGARGPDGARGCCASPTAHPEPAGRVVKVISTCPGDG